MAPHASLATLRAPRGLAARAVLFTTGLLAITAFLSVATVLFGAAQQSARHQLSVTGNLTAHLARMSGNLIVEGDAAELQGVVARLASREEVRGLSIRDERGLVLADHGDAATASPTLDSLAALVLETRSPTHARSPDGGLALAAPIMHEGRFLGVASVMWEGDAYRFNALPALAPFLLILACLTLAAIPLTAHLVRRAVSPLDELARFAARVGEQGHAAPISIKTGDEFETLANAFNHMMGRLETSMRQIEEIAYVDAGTRLPNHDRFIREVDFFILQARPGVESGAVAVFELQRLPRLLQTLDPHTSRDLLRAIAEKLASAAKAAESLGRRSETDTRLTVARLGVVEFAVFAPGLASPAEAARVAQHVNAALNRPFEWRGHKLTLGARCGVAIAPRDGRDADVVIRHARMALAAAQAPQTKLFTQSLDREAMARFTLEREMRSALERSEFRAYFQPKINLLNGRIEACEALARWVRPDRTIISPGRFIPVAEESGLIGPLSDAIMREACWKAAAWARQGRPAKVAVNVSALQFRDEQFAENVLRLVEHAGLPPDHLELEITETVVMENPDRALRIIEVLREAGVRLAIDDFGCGHSSLAALSKLPFDVIKIDQQFVRALERGDPQAAAIIEMILALARTLDMDVVAEGVERREEMEFLAARGCRWIQGFLYGAAVSAPEFAELLRRQAGQERESNAA